MTRKRFIKLMMSQGCDRNGAYAMAEFVRAKNHPYATGYKAVMCIKSIVDDTIPKISEIFQPIVKTMTKIVRAAAAGFEAFGRAYHSEMLESE